MTPAHRYPAVLLCIGALAVTGCAIPGASTQPSAELQAAITYVQAGEPTAALPILSSIANSDTAPEAELTRARVLAAILQLEQGEPDKARKMVEQLESDDPGIDLQLYRRALLLVLEQSDQAVKAQSNLQTCERNNNRLRSEKHSLEKTLKKLRELSLE